MKKILGLDLGTTSIGWAVVNEAENSDEKSSIVKIGSRVVPLTTGQNGEVDNFTKGKSITTNADRTLKRSMRRNLQRFKLRREKLIQLLCDAGWIDDNTVLTEDGKFTTHETYRLRAKAAVEEVTLEEFARILLQINKKRGYKSSRKADGKDEGKAVDGRDIAKVLYESGQTPGQYCYGLILKGQKSLPEFYRSDLQNEFDRIWTFQSAFKPLFFTHELKESLKNKNSRQTWVICQEKWGLEGIKSRFKGFAQTENSYQMRSKALKDELDLENLANVFQDINKQIAASSGYLGDISDRSKELYINHLTVGQKLWSLLETNPHQSLTNIVFYRQDYIDEFDALWDRQAEFHSELTPELKRKIRDEVIFYQRPLKSQKGLVALCEFENRQVTVKDEEGKVKQKTVGMKVAPKSSLVAQEFRIWQRINDLRVNGGELDIEDKRKLAEELAIRDKMSKTDILKLLFKDSKGLSLNFNEVVGNRTIAALLKSFEKIAAEKHGEEIKRGKQSAGEYVSWLLSDKLEFDPTVLSFDATLPNPQFEQQKSFRLWHLIYSYEGDNSRSGNDKLVEHIAELCQCDKQYAKILASTSFESDYCSLSAKAMRRILPYMKDGYMYSDACVLAGYNHSKNSLTKEQLANKDYKEFLEILPKNSLRNPVVEKILNQMINVVNAVVETYGKPDEIRVEMARELKRSAKERAEASSAIAQQTLENEKISELIRNEFGIAHVSRNDIVRYRLWQELESNGYKSLYSNKKIAKEQIFSKEIDIEHIIPQARLFDDSFSNKTLEFRDVNLKKGNRTALDFVKEEYGDDALNRYLGAVKDLSDRGAISKTKYKYLLMSEDEIPDGFINRELRDSQYIARKAKEILESLVPSVVSTTGSVTSRLREDWGLIDIMKELNFSKYDRAGLTDTYSDKDGRTIRYIPDWSKRNDHRHHAMDALTIAFTKHAYIQYLNNLNSRIQKSEGEAVDLSEYDLRDIPKEERSKVIYAIEHSLMERDNGHLRFIPPMPNFRAAAKEQLESVLISIKAKNKVVTRNENVTKTKHGGNKDDKHNSRIQLTPRNQLHNDTVYGRRMRRVKKAEKINGKFDAEKIATVASAKYREALMKRLAEFENDPKKAFTGKNALDKNPIYLDTMRMEAVPNEVMCVKYEEFFTIRKNVSTDLKIEKVVDKRIKTILETRLTECGGDANAAFSNLDENPIWLNREKGIAIKRVTITGMSNAVALHDKKDKFGKVMKNTDGLSEGCDYVSTNGNHHVAIFMDEQGNLQEHTVSCFEATQRSVDGLPIIDYNYNKAEGWQFLFTMKKNEMFVFPNPETGFDPNEIDLLDPENYSLISPNLYRIQKLSSKYYIFRHHQETTDGFDLKLKNTTWKRIQTENGLCGIVKVRINHLGQIVQVGEY